MADQGDPPESGSDKLNDLMTARSGGEILAGLPFAKALGMHLLHSGGGEATLWIPYDARFVGDPETGVIHGGVVTALLDTCGGVAAMSASCRPASTATLDLRIDYMRPAQVGERLFAHAACFRETRSVVFIRGVAFHEGAREEPVAHAVGAFMIESAASLKARSAR